MLPFAGTSCNLSKLTATFLHLFRHGGAEHEHLFVVRSLDEDILDVCTHLGIAKDFVALVNNKEFALNRQRLTLSKWMSLCLARS